MPTSAFSHSPPNCSSSALGGVPTPATPGIWSVSHDEINRAHAESAHTNGPRSSFELVTDVTFTWPYPASSAFVTGTFCNWETTDAMTQTPAAEGSVWIFRKALPPGEYQYKFIIDNVWRHAPEQPTAHDERGIINNVLSVQVEPCGDLTCFCTGLFGSSPIDSVGETEPMSQIEAGIMTPRTIKQFQRNIGVAYKYIERDHSAPFPFRKVYMHSKVSDRPFDVTVVNVKNLPAFRSLMDIQLADGTISRASSMENILDEPLRDDPTIASVSDAAYAATLNDQAGSLPHTAPYRARALSSNPTEFAYSVRARLSSPVLGFNPKECHDGIHLLDTNHCAVRVQERGLYKSVRGVLPILQGPRKVYYELFIFRQSSGGGVCVGLSTHELPLNCLCGTRPNSIGFSTSGSLIQTVDGKETWRDFGDALESGCTIGCLVSMKTAPNKIANGKRSRCVSTEFFVDGKSRGTVEYQFVGELLVFPTLSLLSKHSRVYARFNGQDMLFASSLPMGEEILTLDGQMIGRDAGSTPRIMGMTTTG
ncbi:unnamed protein product [Agarophyton chilense]